MNYPAWKEWYAEIAQALRLSETEDQAATRRLSLLLKRPSDRVELNHLLRGRAAVVFGAGPSLEGDLKRAIEQSALSEVSTICADGSTSAFLRFVGRPPDIIVSDLDGNMDDIVSANLRGGMILVHAHGDNILELNRYVPLLKKPILGTTQVQECPNVHNFGGFTDGDRAAFAAEASGANPIILAGMDFGTIVGAYSKPGLPSNARASERKLLKLRFGRRLLEWLAENGRADIANCTGSGEDLSGIPRVDWSYLRRIIN